MRAWDRRGPATVLRTTVPAHFGLRRPPQVAVAVHAGRIRYADLHVLAPVVFAAAAAGDPVGAGIIAEFADEVACMATALIRRLHLTRSPVEVILGGGTLQTDHAPLRTRITAGITAAAPRARVRVLDVPPIFGALAEAWTHLAAPTPALHKLRRALTPAAEPPA
jgi:N-acetylglucosamine kinase-like BadF-type ATPase